MNKVKVTTMKSSSNAAVCLDSIRMSESDRWRAYEALHTGEHISEFVARAYEDLRAVVSGVKHAATSVGHAVKATFAHPVKH